MFLLGFFLLPSFTAHTLGANDSAVTLEDIQRAITARDSAFSSISFHSASRGWTRLGNSESYLHEEVIIRGRNWRKIRTFHLNRQTIESSTDPNESIAVLTPDKVQILEVMPRILRIDASNISPASNPKLDEFIYDPFITLSGWWPSETFPRDPQIDAHPFQLARILFLPDARLMPERIMIGTSRCAVVVASEGSTTHRMWFDIDNDHVLRRRRIWNAETLAGVQHDNESFTLTGNSVAIPSVQRRIEFIAADAEPSIDGENTVSVFERHLSQVSINSLPEDFFTIPETPGMLKIYAWDKADDVVPGGQDEILGHIVSAVARLHPEAVNLTSGAYRFTWNGLGLLNALLTACILAIIIFNSQYRKADPRVAV